MEIEIPDGLRCIRCGLLILEDHRFTPVMEWERVQNVVTTDGGRHRRTVRQPFIVAGVHASPDDCPTPTPRTP